MAVDRALDDAVEPHIGITNTTVIVADSSKFGYRALTESPDSTISTS